jgi:ABC-2 type transport system ATP-binding protein
MDEADRLADRVAIIDHGKLLVLDTPEALKQTVGEGDVVEITFTADQLPTKAVLGELDRRVNITFEETSLQLRALNLVNLLPGILDRLNSAGFQPDEVRLRGNTLEDVFIQLTGRRLRE